MACERAKSSLAGGTTVTSEPAEQGGMNRVPFTENGVKIGTAAAGWSLGRPFARIAASALRDPFGPARCPRSDTPLRTKPPGPRNFAEGLSSVGSSVEQLNSGRDSALCAYCSKPHSVSKK